MNLLELRVAIAHEVIVEDVRWLQVVDAHVPHGLDRFLVRHGAVALVNMQPRSMPVVMQKRRARKDWPTSRHGGERE